MPEYSSAISENFWNTAMSSLALEPGMKKSMALALEPIGSDVVCQIFQGYISVISSPAGSRSTLTETCGPEAMPRLLARARAALLHMAWQSRMQSYMLLCQK